MSKTEIFYEDILPLKLRKSNISKHIKSLFGKTVSFKSGAENRIRSDHQPHAYSIFEMTVYIEFKVMVKWRPDKPGSQRNYVAKIILTV